jgi:hypothetical protein
MLMKSRCVIAGILAVLTLVLIPSVAFAYCPCEGAYYPPQLNEPQGALWINTHPIARPYLARIWNINQTVAEYYGARYKSPVCGLSQMVPTHSEFVWVDPPTNSSRISETIDGIPIDRYVPTEYDEGRVWDTDIASMETFEPIPIEYPELPQSQPIQLKFDAPPQLDAVQATRWYQALPSARKYLASLWGISNEEAEKYGAR